MYTHVRLESHTSCWSLRCYYSYVLFGHQGPEDPTLVASSESGTLVFYRVWRKKKGK